MHRSDANDLPDVSDLFDKAAALENMGGDEELFAEVVEAFNEEYPQLLAQIRKALSADDRDSLCRAAHTLKGTIRTIGAPSIAMIAQQLELTSQSSELNGAEQLCDQLEASLDALRPVLRGACRS